MNDLFNLGSSLEQLGTALKRIATKQDLADNASNASNPQTDLDLPAPQGHEGSEVAYQRWTGPQAQPAQQQGQPAQQQGQQQPPAQPQKVRSPAELMHEIGTLAQKLDEAGKTRLAELIRGYGVSKVSALDSQYHEDLLEKARAL